MHFIKSLTLGLLILAQTTFSSEILWRCETTKLNEESSGRNFNEAMIFELGAFQDGFIPSAENIEQWVEHWVTLDHTDFNSVNGVFASKVKLENNVAPFTEGESAYIWGFNYRGEWVLLKNEKWTWPDAEEEITFPSEFFTADETTVAVFGEVNESLGGSFYHLKTVQVALAAPAEVREGWRNEQFNPEQLVDSAISDWLADPDNDGRTNLEEFALFLDPNNRDADAFNLSFTAENRPVLSLNGQQNPQARLAIELSVDLKKWNRIPFVFQNSEDKINFLLDRLENNESKVFYRVVTELVE